MCSGAWSSTTGSGWHMLLPHQNTNAQSRFAIVFVSGRTTLPRAMRKELMVWSNVWASQKSASAFFAPEIVASWGRKQRMSVTGPTKREASRSCLVRIHDSFFFSNYIIRNEKDGRRVQGDNLKKNGVANWGLPPLQQKGQEATTHHPQEKVTNCIPQIFSSSEKRFVHFWNDWCGRCGGHKRHVQRWSPS